MEELTTLEKIICQCAFVICPIIMIWVIIDIRKQLRDMRSFGEEIFGETKGVEIKDIEEIKSINNIPVGYEEKLLRIKGEICKN